MTKMKYLVAAGAMIALVGASPFTAYAQAAEDPHHPAGQSVQAGSQAAPPAATSGAGAQAGMMGPQGMMGTGGQGMMGGMPMMNMMTMMQMMGGGDAAGMGMIDHVEGRIAFLRTELKITDAQTGAWNEFAAALRTNAKTLGAARSAMMAQMGHSQAQSQTLTQRLDDQERWLTARLEGTRTLKAAFTRLYGALTDDQKKAADELLAPQMGMMAMLPAGQMGGMGPRQ